VFGSWLNSVWALAWPPTTMVVAVVASIAKAIGNRITLLLVTKLNRPFACKSEKLIKY
jgi:hypothetical protein